MAVLLVGTAIVTAHASARSLSVGETEVAATAGVVAWLALFGAYEFWTGYSAVGEQP